MKIIVAAVLLARSLTTASIVQNVIAVNVDRELSSGDWENRFNDDIATHAHVNDIPSIHDSAVMARRIAQLASHGDLVTSFPALQQDDESSLMRGTPSDVAGSPIALMEYIADCEPDTGNPTILAIDIATPFRNYAAGSNISLSIRWWPKESNIYAWASFLPSILRQDIPTPHTPAALPRFSLHGRIEPIDTYGFNGIKIAQCFIRKHPDSIYWQPKGGAHASRYVRFVIEEIYWFGGFGDRARIGWLPLEEWQSVTQREIDACRLPGED